MRWDTSRRIDRRPVVSQTGERGFTLVEVLVALGIAGGTLILVLSANNASLRQSVDSRLALRLERAVESKFEEIALGSELSMHGDVEGLPGWTWEAVRAPTYLKGLKQLRRITFTVQAPDGIRVLERSTVVHREEKHP